MLSLRDGNPVQRPARLAGLALGVERIGVGDGGWTRLDDGAQRRACIIDLRDAIEVRLRQLVRRQRAGGQTVACVGGGELDDVE
jgi:hypothetical protein